MKKIIIVTIAVIALSYTITHGTVKAKVPFKKAPGIALEDTNGRFNLLGSMLSESNIVISFWSYDCLPCRKEMPELQQMAESELFKQKNVKVVFIYVEAKTENTKTKTSEMPAKEKAVEVLRQLNIKEKCLLDIYGIAFNNYRKANNIKKASMPLLFLVNKNKDILLSAVGYDENNLRDLEKAIKNNL